MWLNHIPILVTLPKENHDDGRGKGKDVTLV